MYFSFLFFLFLFSLGTSRTAHCRFTGFVLMTSFFGILGRRCAISVSV